MMMKKLCAGHKVAWVLVVVGALNWGLVGALNFNLVMKLLGSMPAVERVVYVLVGLAGLMMLGTGKCCMKGGMCACHDDKCGHCAPDKKPEGGMPQAQKPM